MTEFNYWTMMERQTSVISKEKQEIFQKAHITLIGSGGLGGFALENIIRLGAENIKIVDPDKFSLSNLNRQLLATTETINTYKAVAGKKRAQIINPQIKIETITEFFTEENAENIIKGSDIVIDALDNILSRVILARKTKELMIPWVHGAIYSLQGQSTLFTPESPSYEAIFSLPSRNKPLNKETIQQLEKLSLEIMPSFAPIANITSSLMAIQAYKYITQLDNLIISPRVLTFNMEDNKQPFKIIEY